MYKVKALSVGLPGNVIKHSGDIINKGQIKPELAENLVNQGFLELMPNPIPEAGDWKPETTEQKKIKAIKSKPVKSIHTKDIEQLNEDIID